MQSGPENANIATRAVMSLAAVRLPVMAAVSASVGALVLVGWATGTEALKRIGTDMVAMNPLTAICVLIAGTSMALHHYKRPRLGRCLATIIALAALAKILDFTVGGIPIDQLLFGGRLEGAPGTLPNRMAPNTAAALLFVGVALVLVAGKTRAAQLAAQALGLAVMLISMFAVVGYIFGIDRLTAIGPFIPMALHTALALLVIAAGVVSLSRDTALTRVLRDRGPAGTLARIVLPLAVMIPVGIGAARLWGEKLGLFGTEAGVALVAVSNVLVTAVLLVAAILELYRSDCARKEREEALRQSEHFNRTINEASPDCVSLLDQDGNVLFSNDAAVRAYELDDVAQLIGKPWGHRLDPETRTLAQVALNDARKGGVGRLTLSLATSNGDVRWFESLVSKLSDTDGQTMHFIVMSRDITRQKSVEDQVRWAATHDALTGLPNRALFQTRLEQMCHQSKPARFALLVLDLDHFKRVNDTLGHDAGDALLRIVAQRLRHAVRKNDFVARLGGDEFAVILNDVSAEAALGDLADTVAERLKAPWVHDGCVSDCRVSIGASLAPADIAESSELLKMADIALYAAKVGGRGRTAVFEPRMRVEIQKRASQISLARNALESDLIVPSYQPKVELTSGKVRGFEALLRWRHPTRGIQAPALLGAAFEDIELARELTDRMLSRALADMRSWLDCGVDFGHVAINAAPADFAQKDFAERMLDRLVAAGVPAECLQVEVTETVFLGGSAECVAQALKTFSANGIRIALDDFGTGYASLSHLKQFPVDVVKIDRSFLRDVNDPHNAAIIRTVVSLGRSLQLDVVAEGVETLEQQSYLISEGCLLGQGYLYGKAAPASRVPGLVKSGPGGFRLAA